MTIHRPIPDFAAAREAMIESQLRPEGVTDPTVLDAMGRVAREQFLPGHTRPLAYVDRAVAMGEGRFLCAPAVLGQLLNNMQLERGQKALVVGAGTGYSAAVVDAMGLSVTAVESNNVLATSARELGLEILEAPLEDGDARGAPYDRILIDGAIEFVPDAIVEQLADAGILGASIIDRGITRLVIGRKVGGAFGSYSFGDAGVPVLPGFSRPKAFTF